MKLKLLTAAVLLTGASHAAVAEEMPQELKRGAIGGMIVGAAGGPIGAAAGAMIGSEFFGRWVMAHRQNRTLTSEVTDLNETLVAERARHKTQMLAVNQDLDNVLAIQSRSIKQHSYPVQFKTGSAKLEGQYVDELERIAKVLRRNQDASITLSGFADRRGDNDANQRLSEDRVTNVKQFLLAKGVKSTQIRTIAYGESRPVEPLESLESNFFDRRVVMELNMDIDPQLATR